MGAGAQCRGDRQDDAEEYMLGDRPLFVEAIKATMTPIRPTAAS
jgi:hypothetical protein